MVTRGGGGGWARIPDRRAQKLHDELVAKGVEVVDPPTKRFYGTDFGIRDPLGNPIRIVEPAEVMGEPTAGGTMAPETLRKSFNCPHRSRQEHS